MSNLFNAVKAFPDTFAFHASGGRFKLYPHIRYVSEIITPALIKGGARLILSKPPRHGKSEFVSFWTPSWYLETFPTHSIILTSYAAELANSFGRKVRNEMESNPFFTTKLALDSTAAHRFHTREGGGMVTAGVGGPILGKGAHLFIVDDYYKNKEEADSENHRKKIEGWWETTGRTRLEPNASVLVVAQRWRENDFSAYLVKNHGFTEIKMPAIAVENDLLGRAVGEPLCPERYDLEALLSIKKDVGSATWNALYQQNPIPSEGGLFKRYWWRFYKELPEVKRLVQFWDCAQKTGITNDYSVCATWAECFNGFYLIDLKRNKWEAPDLERAAQSEWFKHRPSAVLIEDASSGSSLIQSLRRNTTMPIIPYHPGSRDKEVRASSATPTVEAGRCFLPENAPWLDDFIEEHERFPLSVHDDMVDTTSMMVEYFLEFKTNYRIRQL